MQIGRFLRKIVVHYYRALGVKIGKDVFISHTAKIDTAYPHRIEIGELCYITAHSIILAHDHSVYRYSRDDDGTGYVRLGRNVFVGSGSIIMRDVTIGDNAIVAAGAVVTTDIPANSIVAGNPAKIIRYFTPLE